MIKTQKKSKIIQFHHNSKTSSELLNPDKKSKYIVLQLESVQNETFDFIAEIIHGDDYRVDMSKETIVKVDSKEIKQIVKSHLVRVCDMGIDEAEHLAAQITWILEENQVKEQEGKM